MSTYTTVKIKENNGFWSFLETLSHATNNALFHGSFAVTLLILAVYTWRMFTVRMGPMALFNTLHGSDRFWFSTLSLVSVYELLIYIIGLAKREQGLLVQPYPTLAASPYVFIVFIFLMLAIADTTR